MSPRSKIPTDMDYRATLPSQKKGKGLFVCFLRMSCPIPYPYGCNPESPSSQQEEGKFSPGYAGTLAWEFLPIR